MTLCKSRTGNYWNNSSKIDTVVNQYDHTTPIRSPVHGWTGFSKSRGLRASIPFSPLPHPLPSTILLSPIFRTAQMWKILHIARILFALYGNACYAGYPLKKKVMTPFPIKSTFIPLNCLRASDIHLNLAVGKKKEFWSVLRTSKVDPKTSKILKFTEDFRWFLKFICRLKELNRSLPNIFISLFKTGLI